MLYIVTGAYGHLGGVIVKTLTEQGKRVRGLVLQGEKPLLPEIYTNVEIVEGNVCDKDSLEQLFVGDESKIVIHTAGLISVESHIEPALKQVNVNGTANIVDLCINHNARLVYVSSIHATAELPRGQTTTESDDFSPERVHGGYAKTKALATQIVLDAVKNRHLDGVVVQPSGIIGPYDNGKNHMVSMVLDYLTGNLTAIVKGGYDLVDVRDVATATITAAERGKDECYFLTNKHYDLKYIVDTLQQLTGVKKINAVLPIWFAKGFVLLAELYYKARKKRPLYTVYSMRVLKSNDSFDSTKARNELGFDPRPLDDTLRDTVDWLVQALSLELDTKKKVLIPQKKQNS